MSTILDEYLDYTTKYQLEYGKRTIVLMEVGSFYEMYATDSAHIDLHAVGNMLNIQVTRKNKSIAEVSRANHLLAGFPSYCLEKFTNILLDNNYTVVVVSQTSPPPKPNRGVTNVLSPGMRLEPVLRNENSFLLCIYLDEGSSNPDSLLGGVSYIDVSTGEVFAYECGAATIEELHRILISVCPKEVLIVGRIDPVKYARVEARLFPATSCIFHVKVNHDNDSSGNPHFQLQLLQTAYPKHGILNVVEYLGFERLPIALNSFVHLLGFAHRHREDILNNIRKPKLLQNDDKVILSNNACRHLDILPKKEGTSGLVQMLNRCKTSIGKRGFRRRILNPVNDTGALNDMYNMMEWLIETNNWRILRNHLSDVCDLERAFRRIGLGELNWQGIPAIHTSLKMLQGIIDDTNLVLSCPVESASAAVTSASYAISKIVTFYSNVIDIEKLLHSGNNPFITGLFLEIDKVETELKTKHDFIQSMGDDLNGTGEVFFRIEKNDKDGYHYCITAKRYKAFVDKGAIKTLTRTGIKVKELVAKSVSASSSIMKITHDSLRQVNTDIIVLEEEISKLVEDQYKRFLARFAEACNESFDLVVDFVEYFDFVSTNASNAIKYSYVKPKIEGNDSFVDIKQLRHPIIEMIQDGIPYVPNDICLGSCTKGMLMYGVNASGKSSLMKSVGVALVMACAGMYVPCASMRYYPFNRIFTRIPSGDDMYAGHSTFTQEISELRSILNHADQRSLVIGDELCSGTEPISAISIVAAGILRLMQKGTSFIFASHLHDIVELPQIKALGDDVMVCHLGVNYDGTKLIYDRVLKPGAGETLYGIEVCRALDLEPEFMAIAQTIRHNVLAIEPMILSTKRTRYNAKVFKDAMCKMCRHNRATEVHHIVQQKDADQNGNVLGRFHKNAKHNLVHICETCHRSIHDGDIEVSGYSQTSSGIELIFKKIEHL